MSEIQINVQMHLILDVSNIPPVIVMSNHSNNKPINKKN